MNEKYERIAAKIQETRTKRLSQKCRVFELKIDESRLNKTEKEQLKMFFVEAKWLYNHILGHENPFDVTCKIKQVLVKYGEESYIEQDLKFLSSKNKQNKN